MPSISRGFHCFSTGLSHVKFLNVFEKMPLLHTGAKSCTERQTRWVQDSLEAAKSPGSSPSG